MGVHAAATWHPQFWGDPVFSKVAAYVSCSLPRVGVNVARTWAALPSGATSLGPSPRGTAALPALATRAWSDLFS
jgi:hypothetical protein